MTRALPTSCDLCPRRCGADRAAGARGVCGAGDGIQVARAALHFWEEPPISGTQGSGTVFFSGCPLRWVYCQNHAISRGHSGKTIDVQRLSQIYLELQEKGAHNINLVTPTHYRPQILDALDIARAQGLSLPVVYNTSGYETVDSIRALQGYVDIYLTDFKYVSPHLAARYSNAADYARVATAALDAMVEQLGEYRLAAEPIAAADPADPDSEPLYLLERGVIVRHLMLPGQLEDSKAVVRHVLERHGDSVRLSLMNQYTPLLAQLAEFPELRCGIDMARYDVLIDYALDLGAQDCFIQEGGTATESFIPSFDNEGV
ncbi:MAG: radical SAM protein [Coriobacteriales bacterium]|nr:radical SAM protein [Coriobacteriales bacterium]